MTNRYDSLSEEMRGTPRRWCVTGAAGFIGSNLVETLLTLGQEVVGLDNFATGHRSNLDLVEKAVGQSEWRRFRFVEGDIRDQKVCSEALRGCDVVLHQAALGSVPRSIKDPATSNAVNVDGFINVALAARDANAKRFVYASSSSVYGDAPELPKHEDRIGRPLSPYAVTKLVNEHYSEVFSALYGLEMIGLRYFNVFGPRQDPLGEYAAVIPRWINAMVEGADITVNGDGETSRDFCYVDNVVQANLLAATTSEQEAINQVYNIACGERTTLNELLQVFGNAVSSGTGKRSEIRHGPERPGDVRHSLASIEKARRLLGYEPRVSAKEGLARTVEWFVSR